MEALDSYYHSKIYINNKRSIFHEISYALECFITSKITFKQLYLLLLLSTSIVYAIYSIIYIIYDMYWMVLLDFVYCAVAISIISLYFNKNFYLICTAYVYFGSHICMAILIYNFGFASGMWFFVLMMIYFSSVVTLENTRSSRIIFAVQLVILLVLYFLDTFVWSHSRVLNQELIHILYILSFVAAMSLYVALSLLCSINNMSFYTQAQLGKTDDIDINTKSRYDIYYKKYFINELSILFNTHKQTKSTHFVLLDLSYKAHYKNSLSKNNISIRVEMNIAQALKLYFPHLSFIAHWGKDQYMFVLFDKSDEYVFSVMQIFMKECKRRLQNIDFDEIYQTGCACACARFGDFSKINLKQAIYETENLLSLSRNYDNDSIFVANYTKQS